MPLKAGDQYNMQQLLVSHNSMSRAIPSIVSMISTPIPLLLGNLPQLKPLELNENRLSGGIPNTFLNLTSPLELNISYNFRVVIVLD